MKDLLTDFKTSAESVNYEAQVHWISYVIPVFFIVIGSVGFSIFYCSDTNLCWGLWALFPCSLFFFLSKGSSL